MDDGVKDRWTDRMTDNPNPVNPYFEISSISQRGAIKIILCSSYLAPPIFSGFALLYCQIWLVVITFVYISYSCFRH